MSTPEQRQQWAQLAAAATPGEWKPRMDYGKDMTLEGDVFYFAEAQGPHIESGTWQDMIDRARADAAFIAAARAAVPALLADVDALTQERDMWRWKYLDTQAGREQAAKNARTDRDVLEEDVAQVTRERDALAAELERVRAQLAEASEQLETEREIAREMSYGEDW